MATIMSTFVPCSGQDPKKLRSRPIAAGDWEGRRKDINEWHTRGLSAADIQILLAECGFRPTWDQLWRKMAEWKLTRETKGQGQDGLESTFDDADYHGGLIDAMDSAWIVGDVDVAPEQESSRGSMNLRDIRSRHAHNAFRVGTVFLDVGELDPKHNKCKVKLWVVASAQIVNGMAACIRIKSFGGRGVRGAIATNRKGATTQGPRTDCNQQQGSSNRYAIVHCGDSSEAELLAHETNTMRPLQVRMDPDLPENILPDGSFAVFTTHRQISCNKELVLIGRLDTFSIALLEIYFQQLLGEMNCPVRSR